MPKLPAVTGAEAIKAFEHAGFTVVRTSGSHHILGKEGHPLRLSIPVHGNTALKRGLLRSQIRCAGLTVAQFIQHLQN